MNSYFMIKGFAPGEARTHGLQIMRLTRCRLRYRGLVIISYVRTDENGRNENQLEKS